MSVNLPEVLLRLACTDCKEYTIESEKEEFVRLNERAKGRWGGVGNVSRVVGMKSRFGHSEPIILWVRF